MTTNNVAPEEKFPWKRVGTIISIIIGICTLITVGIKVTANFASANDLKETKQELTLSDQAIQQQVAITGIRLDLKIAEDKAGYYRKALYQTQDRISMVKSRGQSPPQADIERERELKDQLDTADHELKTIRDIKIKVERTSE